ncbi:hypothetical protein ACJX0J_036613, partial [Zea mays]
IKVNDRIGGDPLAKEEEQVDGLSILQYAYDILNNSDWKTRGSRENRLLAKWDILCQPKDQGGLGIQNIDLINEDGIATVATVLATVPLNVSWQAYYIL